MSDPQIRTDQSPQDTIRTDLRFAMIPEWVGDADISSHAVRVYYVMARYAGEDGGCFPKRATAAKRARIGVSTFDRAMTELRGIGAITSRMRHVDGSYCEHATTRECKRKGLDHGSNEYTVHMLPPSVRGVPTGDDRSSHGRGQGVPTGDDRVSPQVGTISDNHYTDSQTNETLLSELADASPDGGGGEGDDDPDVSAPRAEPTPTEAARADVEQIKAENPAAYKLAGYLFDRLKKANVRGLPSQHTLAAYRWVVEMDRLVRLGAKGGEATPEDPAYIARAIDYVTGGYKYAPVVESATSLRDKWPQICQHLDRNNDKRGNDAAPRRPAANHRISRKITDETRKAML